MSLLAVGFYLLTPSLCRTLPDTRIGDFLAEKGPFFALSKRAAQDANGGRLERRVGVLRANNSANVRRILRDLLSAFPRLDIPGERTGGFRIIELIEKLLRTVISQDIQTPDMPTSSAFAPVC